MHIDVQIVEGEIVCERIRVVRSQAFPTGVLDSLQSSLNEVADNVLVHSSADVGWAQLTSYEKKAEVEFVVVDSGRGIRDSLSEAIPDLKDDRDAIVKAAEKGTTRTAR